MQVHPSPPYHATATGPDPTVAGESTPLVEDSKPSCLGQALRACLRAIFPCIGMAESTQDFVSSARTYRNTVKTMRDNKANHDAFMAYIDGEKQRAKALKAQKAAAGLSPESSTASGIAQCATHQNAI